MTGGTGSSAAFVSDFGKARTSRRPPVQRRALDCAARLGRGRSVLGTERGRLQSAVFGRVVRSKAFGATCSAAAWTGDRSVLGPRGVQRALGPLPGAQTGRSISQTTPPTPPLSFHRPGPNFRSGAECPVNARLIGLQAGTWGPISKNLGVSPQIPNAPSARQTHTGVTADDRTVHNADRGRPKSSGGHRERPVPVLRWVP